MNEERTEIARRAVEKCAYTAARNVCREFGVGGENYINEPGFQMLKDLVVASFLPTFLRLTEFAYQTSAKVDQLRGSPTQSIGQQTQELLDMISAVPDELMPERVRLMAKSLEVNLNDI